MLVSGEKGLGEGGEAIDRLFFHVGAYFRRLFFGIYLCEGGLI